MLTITVPGVESFDEVNQKFITSEPTILHLEHSLVSLSKWESIFKKSFLSNDKKSSEETYAYIHAMCLDENVSGEIFFRLTPDNFKEVNDYIEDQMTATTFRELPGRVNREVITNEIIRYWMISFQIPLEYETRHLNQLFTLIKVINEKNKPQKNMSRADLAARNRELNEQRQKQYGTAG